MRTKFPKVWIDFSPILKILVYNPIKYKIPRSKLQS